MEVNLNIEDEDMDFLKDNLKSQIIPLELEAVVYKLALFKTRELRNNRVKIYNPDCEYKVGDLIYKEYPGKIPIGAKKFIEMDRGVVLRVAETRERFGLHEIKLCYDGTSDFKNYTDYLDRQKIELLLPHKEEEPYKACEYLDKGIDPRQEQDPLVERDFNFLRRRLISALNKDADIAFISSKVLLNKNLKPIGPEVFERIKDFLKENKQSATTEFLVENFVRVDQGAEDFPAYCFALNHKMKTTYKIDFQQTNDVGWGKWNLISVIYYMKKNSIMSTDNPLINRVIISDRKNIAQKRRKFEESIFTEGGIKFYLTQREIQAGAVRLKSCFFDQGESIEVEVIDGKTKKSHLLYYYRDANLIFGFKEIFERYKALQGTIITFEQAEDKKIYFNLRTTKKGIVADKIEYNPEKKAFRALEEKVASPVFVNKAMFLEPGIFNTLYEKIDEFRKVETLNKLIHKVFLEFGIKERNYEIHILRLFHILDLVYPVEMKLVEDVLLGNAEFVPSEKVSGVFYLDSDAVAEIEEEEVLRRRKAVDDSKRKREEMRRKKMDEELRLRDEIRKKREDRRRKREEEMWMKERLKREREEKRLQELKKKKEAPRKEAAVEVKAPIRGKEAEVKKKFDREYKRDFRKKEKERPFKPKPDLSRPQKERILEELPGKPVHPKKVKKRIEEEKPQKTPKKIGKEPIVERLSEDEIKSQIQLEELKAKIIVERREKLEEMEKKKEIAYQDNGGFGGVLASKLDEIVKKKEDEKGKKDKAPKK